MTERKWTPGPWGVVEGSESGHCCFDYSITSPLKGGCNVVAEIFCGDAPDAHIIAAAPELYEALDDIVRNGDDWVRIENARAALAKARGES